MNRLGPSLSRQALQGGRQPAAKQVETSASMLRGRAEAAQAELQVAQLQAELRGAEARAAQTGARVSAFLNLGCSTRQAAREVLWPHCCSDPAVPTASTSSCMSERAAQGADGVQPSSRHHHASTLCRLLQQSRSAPSCSRRWLLPSRRQATCKWSSGGKPAGKRPRTAELGPTQPPRATRSWWCTCRPAARLKQLYR